MELTRHYLTQMLENKNLSSSICAPLLLAWQEEASHAYSLVKHALAGFTKRLALDYAEAGIQVFGIGAGSRQKQATAADFEPGGLADWVASETPIKRWIKPEE